MAPRDVAGCGREETRRGSARAEAQKGRSHKKGAGKAAQLEQQKAEEERRKREEAEKRAALAAQPATRGKKSKEEDLVQVLPRRPSERPFRAVCTPRSRRQHRRRDVTPPRRRRWRRRE